MTIESSTSTRVIFKSRIMPVNSFHAISLLIDPLETLENKWFSYVFKGYRKRPMACNMLMYTASVQ